MSNHLALSALLICLASLPGCVAAIPVVAAVATTPYAAQYLTKATDSAAAEVKRQVGGEEPQTEKPVEQSPIYGRIGDSQ